MSYDSSSTDDRDLARGLLGDIDEASELRADAHYDAMLTLYGLNGAIAFIASSLAAEYARKPDRVTLPNGLSVSWSSRVATWKALATTFQAGGLTPATLTGGVLTLDFAQEGWPDGTA